MNYIKLVVVGSCAVGKTSLLYSQARPYARNHFLTECAPTVFDNYSSDVTVRGVTYNLRLWDTAGMEVFDLVRHISYPDTDVFLICYSVNNRFSFEEIRNKWFRQVTCHRSNTPVLIAATKIDLRRSDNTNELGQQCVSYEEGAKLAQELHCGFVETSALTQTGVKECFDEAVSLHLSYSRRKTPKVIRPVPPAMPPVDPAPRIEIKTSTFGTDMASILDDPSETDYQREDRPVRVPAFTWDKINRGRIAGLSSIKQAEEGVGHQVDVRLSADISSQTFTHLLRFLYAGDLDKNIPGSDLDALLKAADIFYLPKLREIITNIQNNEEHLNLPIGICLNELSCQRSKKMFFNKPVFSDVQFEVEGQILYAHKAILKARCTVMAGMFSGVFAESSASKIPILETSTECFMAVLEYIYTDHAPIETGDSVGILVLAERFAQDRLKNLCELYITKELDSNVRDEIEKTDIDVIGLLKTAQLHNADQLSAWCLHFISINYQAFEKRSEFSQLEGDNLAYVTEKRWPPASCVEELEIWKENYGDRPEKLKKCSVM